MSTSSPPRAPRTRIDLTVGAHQYPRFDRCTDAELAAMPDTDRVVALALIDAVADRLRGRRRPIAELPPAPFFQREDLLR